MIAQELPLTKKILKSKKRVSKQNELCLETLYAFLVANL